MHYAQRTGRITQIISGFPGIGKTHWINELKGPKHYAIDSDSSKFSWKTSPDGVKYRDSNFPENYMAHILSTIGAVETVLVSSHDIVRSALRANNIYFFLVYPDRDIKKEYIERYVARKSNPTFVDLLNTHWDDWIDELENQVGCTQYVLRENQYLSDVMPIIKGLV